MEKQLSTFEQLLSEFNQLEPLAVAEPTIFDIGTRGYYENPTTDILAFFCDTNGSHQLGDTALKALIRCLPEKYHALDSSLIEKPEREVRTFSGKRIDLLLEGTDWVIVLENKIYHQQNNPFDDYERFIQEEQNQNRFNGKDILFVVLSPTGDSLPDDWHGISYPKLIAALKTELVDQFLSQPTNKWTLFLREFILHLESLMSQPSVSKPTLDFVLENLSAIQDLQKTKQQAINEYHQQLQKAIHNNLKREVDICLQHWGSFPALRFALSSWEDSKSDVVLFLSGDPSETSITVYANLRSIDDQPKADSLIAPNLDTHRWVEGGNQYRAYRIKSSTMTNDTIAHYIGKRLLELDEFESRIHGDVS